MISNNELIGSIKSNSLIGRILTKVLGLDFVWDGTRLGVKKENEEEYQYSDLVGPEGPEGPAGQDRSRWTRPVKMAILLSKERTILHLKKLKKYNIQFQTPTTQPKPTQ